MAVSPSGPVAVGLGGHWVVRPGGGGLTWRKKCGKSAAAFREVEGNWIPRSQAGNFFRENFRVLRQINPRDPLLLLKSFQILAEKWARWFALFLGLLLL